MLSVLVLVLTALLGNLAKDLILETMARAEYLHHHKASAMQHPPSQCCPEHLVRWPNRPNTGIMDDGHWINSGDELVEPVMPCRRAW